jgi:hypothetical protein
VRSLFLSMAGAVGSFALVGPWKPEGLPRRSGGALFRASAALCIAACRLASLVVPGHEVVGNVAAARVEASEGSF